MAPARPRLARHARPVSRNSPKPQVRSWYFPRQYNWDPGQDVDYIAGVATELLSRHWTPRGRVLLTGATLERKRRRCRPGMGAGQRHHGSTGGSRREPDPHPDDLRRGRATKRGDAVDVTRGRSHLALRAPRAAAEPLPWPHVPRDRRHQVDLGVRATPRRRSVTGREPERPRTSGRDLRRHRRQRLRPRRSWLLTQCPARTAEVREISPASTVAAQISASLRTLPLP
jgi:hypothetical protein